MKAGERMHAKTSCKACRGANCEFKQWKNKSTCLLAKTLLFNENIPCASESHHQDNHCSMWYIVNFA